MGNLFTVCKSCNAMQAHDDKKRGRGVRTRQYNPRTKGAINLAQYVQAAIDHVRGSHDAGGKVIHETPKSVRQEFAREIWWRRGHRGNPPKDIIPEFWAGKLRDSHGKLVSSEAQAKAILLSELRAIGRIPPRKNPGEADDLYRTFHGRGPDQRRTLLVSEVDPYGSHPKLAQLGFLVRFIVGEGIAKMGGPEGDQIEAVIEGADHWASEISFVPLGQWEKMENSDASPQELKRWLRAHGAPDVAGVPPKGHQLYIVGGDQNIDAQLGGLGANADKELIDCGFAYFVEYYTQKKFDNYDPVSYFHHFGEKTGDVPRLTYNRLQHRLELVGGDYKVTWRGIEN